MPTALAASLAPTSVFSHITTPAGEITRLSHFVLLVTGAIYLSVTGLLLYCLMKYRKRPGEEAEPAQVFGSIQIELAWTIIPILLIVVLFLGTARIVFAVQDAPKPASALDVVVIGHQFWWEFRYPRYNVVTANELHIPLSDPAHPTPTFLKLTSADVMHSFWVPQLDGKTDVVPNRVNEMWFDPHQPGLYVGQCAQFCGQQHAKMLLRVIVDTPADFARWIAAQQQPQQSGTTSSAPTAPAVQPNPGNQTSSSPVPPNSPATRAEPARAALSPENEAINPEQGRRVFEEQACINCHQIRGTVANGRYGPDLTHLMSRATIASGIVENNRGNLETWIAEPNHFKPGSLMPAMHLNDTQNAQIAAYLATLY